MLFRIRPSTLLPLVMLALAAAPLPAQERRPAQPQMPKENIRVSAKLKGLRPGMLHLVTGEGDQYLVKVELKPQDITFSGSAAPNWLRAGMFVRFTGYFSKSGEARDAVRELTVFTPRESTKLGVFPDSGLNAGNELFADVKEKPAKSQQYAPFLVSGRLTRLNDGKMTIAAGRASVKAALAEDAGISLDMADYRMARPGDSVYLEAWYYPPRKTHLYAKRLQISAAQPLGETKQAAPKEVPDEEPKP